ncbi:MAG: GIY-YIG nuclease family protein [Candidatus Dojkabacteria bacterium]
MGYYFVYLMTNKYNKTIYCGITNNLIRRCIEHTIGINKKSYTFKYNISRLVYYEVFLDPKSAIGREKQIKNYSRNSKILLIEKVNSEWVNLFDEDSRGIATLRSQ